MAGTPLTTSFKDKDQVKAPGARWDAERRCWYVPDAMDLVPFAGCLPTSMEPLPERAGQAAGGYLTALAPTWRPPCCPPH